MTAQVDNVHKARSRIQFAYSRIIGRFGSEADVIEALVEGLELLKGLSDEDIKPKGKALPPDISGDITTIEKPKRRATRRTTRK